MRLGVVKLDVKLEYVVDLDNPEMVEYAQEMICEDMNSLNQEDFSSLFKKRASKKLTEADIPEFIQEAFDGEED